MDAAVAASVDDVLLLQLKQGRIRSVRRCSRVEGEEYARRFVGIEWWILT
jgi:hypothetical protein